jgi:spore coat protein U-like protein
VNTMGAVGSARAGLAVALLLACGAALAQSCTVASGGMLAFLGVVALDTTADQDTDSGQSFRIACDSAVAATLRVYSATPHVLRSGGHALPFNLSLNSGAGSDDFPAGSPGAQIALARNGKEQPVTLYARLFSRDFRSLPAGTYSAALTLTLEY